MLPERKISSNGWLLIDMNYTLSYASIALQSTSTRTRSPLTTLYMGHLRLHQATPLQLVEFATVTRESAPNQKAKWRKWYWSETSTKTREMTKYAGKRRGPKVFAAAQINRKTLVHRLSRRMLSPAAPER
jgi:hypothetical protein